MKAAEFVKSLFGDDEHTDVAHRRLDARKLLETQHREVDALFEQLEAALRGDKRAVLVELASNLVAHSAIEKEILYPALRKDQDEGILEAFEEHALVEHCLAKALATQPGDESFDAKVTVLKELVEHHVEEEENEILKQAERDLDDEVLADLGERMLARFEEIKNGDWPRLLALATGERLASALAASTPKPAHPRPRARARAAKKPAAKPRSTRTGGATAKRPAKRAASKKAARPTKASRKRELVEVRGDKRYVRRAAKGRFAEVVDVGRSLSQDRRRKAKTRARKGEGDRGDR
jgi:hypothetical protein